MATAFEQIDSFHESICKLHLYADILDSDGVRPDTKQKYYSIDEYLANQKQVLIADVKAQLQRHAQVVIDRFRDFQGSTYNLAHRSRLKKFFALEFHLTHPTFVDKKISAPVINQSDLLVIFNCEDPTQRHMLAVVDSAVENLLIAKVVLREADDLDERNYNLYNMLTSNSQWQVVRICSLENFNKSYLGVLGIDNCPLRESILDLTLKPKVNAFPEACDLKQTADSLAGFALNDSQFGALKQCLAESGISSVRGGFGAGKTSLVPCLAKMFLDLEKQLKEKKQAELKAKVVKKYSIKELLANDSSDDEAYSGVTTAKTQFPWHTRKFLNRFDEVTMDTAYEYERQLPRLLKQVAVVETPAPKRILIVSPTINGCDHILDLLTPLAKQFKISRIGQSARADLDKKFGLKVNPKEDQAQVKI